MRTLSTIIIIVIILLGGSFASYRYIETATQTTRMQLEVVEQSVSLQKWEGAKSELTFVREKWVNNNTWWSILLDHEEIERINLSISRLEKLIDRQDVTLSLGEVSTLKLLFQNIHDNEKFVLKNIL